MSNRSTGTHRGCGRHVEGRLPLELRLPCFSSLSRRFDAMTALRRSSPGAQLPGAIFLGAAHREIAAHVGRESGDQQCSDQDEQLA